MTTSTANRVLPAGSSFNAVVNGKPTGLAGCSVSSQCPRSANCLRADAGLPLRADLCGGKPAACVVFIPVA